MNGFNRSDDLLLDEYLTEGSEAAFDEIVRRHRAMVFGACRRVCADPNDAEDAAQAVFATLAGKAQSLRNRSSLAGWLYQAAWRHSMRLRRSAATRRSWESRSDPLAYAADRTPEVEMEWNEARRELWRALAMLPDDQRDAVVLHHLENLTVVQVAEVLGCPIGTVAARIARGRAALRDRLTWRGVELPAVMVECGWALGNSHIKATSAALRSKLTAPPVANRVGVMAGGAMTPPPAVGPMAISSLSPTLVASSAGVVVEAAVIRPLGGSWFVAGWVRRAAAIALVGSVSITAAASYRAYVNQAEPVPAASHRGGTIDDAFIGALAVKEATESEVDPSKPSSEPAGLVALSFDYPSAAVPEPSSGLLVAVGAALLLPRRRSGQSRSARS